MGPSGSGKTTLLDVLAGRKTVGTTEGLLSFGGVKPTRQFLRRYTGYVEQVGGRGEALTWQPVRAPTSPAKRTIRAPYPGCALCPAPPKASPARSKCELLCVFGTPQFDTLLGDLTVREMLTYTAELKRPVSEPLADKKREASWERSACLCLDRARPCTMCFIQQGVWATAQAGAS
jgi:ATP-binding cassette subfamily G (WHITE) protein 2